MTGPLAALDRLFAPIIIAANKARQARDRLPLAVWRMVPVTIRGPVDDVFAAVEFYETFLGRIEQGSTNAGKPLSARDPVDGS